MLLSLAKGMWAEMAFPTFCLGLPHENSPPAILRLSPWPRAEYWFPGRDGDSAMVSSLCSLINRVENPACHPEHTLGCDGMYHVVTCCGFPACFCSQTTLTPGPICSSFSSHKVSWCCIRGSSFYVIFINTNWPWICKCSLDFSSFIYLIPQTEGYNEMLFN